MSDIENRKVQDILREVAEIGEDGSIDDSWEHTLATLRDAVEVKPTPTWSGDLAACFREIADRIDRQSVVEVQVPPQKTDYDGATTELEALPMPAVIDVHDCIIEVHVCGGADDQD